MLSFLNTLIHYLKFLVPIHEIDFDDSCEVLRRSKKQKKKFSFENDFYTYLVGPSTLFEVFLSPDAPFWKKAMKTELDSLFTK